MTVSTPHKIRAIGSASALALTVGLAGTALAQSAPPPVGTPPTPAAPTTPANVEQCAVTDGVLTCAPGTDPDGFIDVSGDAIGLDVQEGAFVQSAIIITGEVDGSVDGSIVTTLAFDNALLLGGGSDVTINGFVQTLGATAVAIETEDGSTVTVGETGTIYTAGAGSDGIALATGSSATNGGLIVTEGDDAAGILAFGDDVTVDNLVTGSIITSGSNSDGIEGSAGLDVGNDGLIQTFGDFSSGVTGGDASSVDNTGNIVVLGDFAFGVSLGDDATVTNSGLIATTGATAGGVSVGANSSVTNTDTISTEGDDLSDAVALGAGSTLTNGGTIAAEGTDSFGVFGFGEDVTVTNTGLITTNGDGGFGVFLNNGGVLANDGDIETNGAFALGVEAFSDVSVTNNGSITTTGESATAVNFRDGGTLVNNGSIAVSGDGANAVSSANDAVLTNSATGTISSADGFGVSLINGGELTNRGSISGATGVSGVGTIDQTVVNFGSIVGTDGTAVALREGSDEFQQWTGASTDGDIDLGDGDDTFILEGSASSVGGTIIGGAGTDAAIIAGLLDADNFDGFEAFQIGSTLGGTLNDAVISGDRTLDGDVSVVGQVALDLGVDTLTSTGSMTLEDGSEIVVGTPLDTALIGQTVTLLTEGTTFTDNGATFTVLDDDLLVDYTVIGSQAVQVSGVNPITVSADPNVVTFGTALNGALVGGNLSQATFDLLNDLPDASALEAIALDSLPNLSGGAGREIFESSSAASSALTRHLSGEGTGVWGEVIIRGADQDASSLSAGGYESEQTIITGGVDFAVGEGFRVGLLASYADIENDDLSRGVERGETQIEGLKFGAYASTGFGGGGYFNGEIAYLTGDVDTVRDGGLGVIGSSFDYDGWAYSATVGFDLAASDTFALTPFVGINGANISFDDAVEAGGFGYTVARDDADFLELRGGIAVSSDFSDAFSFYASATGIYDLEDDGRVFNLTSADFGTFAVVLPERDQERLELAAGLMFDVSDAFSLGFGYLGDFADGYDAHAARANVRFAF